MGKQKGIEQACYIVVNFLPPYTEESYKTSSVSCKKSGGLGCFKNKFGLEVIFSTSSDNTSNLFNQAYTKHSQLLSNFLICRFMNNILLIFSCLFTKFRNKISLWALNASSRLHKSKAAIFRHFLICCLGGFIKLNIKSLSPAIFYYCMNIPYIFYNSCMYM